MVQPLSIQTEPELGFERSAEDPRRYFTEKKMIGRKMTAMKKREISVNAKNNASTSCEVVEACGGNRRNWSIVQLIDARPPADRRVIEKSHHAIAATNPRL